MHVIPNITNKIQKQQLQVEHQKHSTCASKLTLGYNPNNNNNINAKIKF